jgi:hypothetical protein
MTQQLSYKTENMSAYAIYQIQKFTAKPLYIEEVKSWDGVDQYGPEMILYDLYVVLDKSPSTDLLLYEYQWYHIEYYVNVADGPSEYNLEKIEYHNLLDPGLFTS